jgi:hypothetical protein
MKLWCDKFGSEVHVHIDYQDICPKAGQTLIVQKLDRHLLSKSLTDTYCPKAWQTLIVQKLDRHLLSKSLTDTYCPKFVQMLTYFVVFNLSILDLCRTGSNEAHLGQKHEVIISSDVTVFIKLQRSCVTPAVIGLAHETLYYTHYSPFHCVDNNRVKYE